MVPPLSQSVPFGALHHLVNVTRRLHRHYQKYRIFLDSPVGNIPNESLFHGHLPDVGAGMWPHFISLVNLLPTGSNFKSLPIATASTTIPIRIVLPVLNSLVALGSVGSQIWGLGNVVALFF